MQNKFRIDRVMVNEFEGNTPERAKEKGILPDIVFVRDDGWSLGAPFKFEVSACSMWEDKWSHFFYTGRADVPHNWRMQLFSIQAYPIHVEVRAKIALAVLQSIIEDGEL